MRHCSLFTGIGGFDLASDWMGWKNIFQVEKDKFCTKKLEKNFSNVKRYGDIKEFDGTEYRGLINILTGGFPCQPFSVAGKQKGQSDDRHLWPEMLRVIREVHPAWIVGENVPGIIRMELENICLALESEGYEVQPFIIPSASIGSWDKRDRVWIIAYNGLFGQAINEKQTAGSEQRIEVTSNSDGERLSKSGQESKKQKIHAKFGIKYNDFKNPDTHKFNGNNAGYNSGAISQQQTSGIQINNNITGIGREDRIYGNKQEREAGKRNYHFKESDWWKRDWIKVASELCGSNARVSSELDEVINLYRNGNSNNQETIAKIDLFRREVLRDMWCEGRYEQTPQYIGQKRCNDIMPTMPYQYTHERWELGQRIEKDKILCDLWNGILSASFEETQDLQSEMLERVREIERGKKANKNRMDRIKALGNSVNPYVVYALFKFINDYEKLERTS